MQILNLQTPGILFALGMAVLVFVLMRRTYRRVGGRTKDQRAIVEIPRPTVSSTTSMSENVELYETSRALSAQLDNKMIALDVLIRQADERIAELKLLSGEAETAPQTPSPDTTESPSPEDAEIHALAQRGYSPVTIAHRVGQPLDKVEAVLANR